ncbi:MAG: phosphoribosylanthranilate isomerase [Bacteroidaceae bacterium]|nr:phosphoribosylanthranilate isomerase [Bacteroidaceae bacterium]
MIVKVCGMRDAENIREVEGFGIDLMGFIFWPKSKRYVSERPAYLPTKCKRVGVFVDASIDDIGQHIADYALDIVQLHGQESLDFIRRLRSVYGDNVAVIKAFNIATTADLDATKPYEGVADYFLFDTKTQLPGGSGQQFEWSVLETYNGLTPFLLSGGIGPDDAERVRTLISDRACSRSPEQTSSLCSRSIAAFHHPKCIGIDLNSRFETAPALKDISKLKQFIKEIRL